MTHYDGLIRLLLFFSLFHMLIKVKITWVDKKKKKELRVRLHIYTDKRLHILNDAEQRNNKKGAWRVGLKIKKKKKGMLTKTWLVIINDYMMRNV